MNIDDFFQMKYFLYLLLLFICKVFQRMYITKKNKRNVLLIILAIQGQCSGGIWPIQNATIGSFTVSWRYNMASNTVQFIIQGKVIVCVIRNSLLNNRTSNI
jgi:hypothetical protein